MKMMRLATAALGLMLATLSTRANNMVVTNAMLLWNTTNTARVKFDISWENSWRYTNINHDAAWVFFKVQKAEDVSNNWQHVTLEGTGINPPGYLTGVGTPIEIIVPEDRVGLLVRRSAEGSGTTSVQNVQAIWNFATNGLSEDDMVRLRVMAIEMVYVPEGSFHLGSGATDLQESGCFLTPPYVAMDQTNLTYFVQSEAQITISSNTGSLWNSHRNSDASIGPDGILPAAFPKGYAPFYCMKYEVTQGQYADYLNMLTRTQQTTRTRSQLPSFYAVSGSNVVWYNNGIRCPDVIPESPASISFGCDFNGNGVFNESSDGMDLACNYLSLQDRLAYADWAGLRPMTELEYEKACRGTNEPVKNEFPWGSTYVNAQTGHTGTVGSGTETASPASANCNCNSIVGGPVRVGIYATNGATRVSSGSSFWGIMELSGNVWEGTITVYLAHWRLFTGVMGDGTLTADGKADVATWPTTDTAGYGGRGGNWLMAGSYYSVSARRKVSSNYEAFYFGCRCVRNAPAWLQP